MFSVRNKTRNTTLTSHTRIAESFAIRLVGLSLRKSIPAEEGMWFPRCRFIHTMGMRFAIDVLALDRRNHVIMIYRNLRPFGFAWAPYAARAMLEVPAGTVERSHTQVGDILELS